MRVMADGRTECRSGTAIQFLLSTFKVLNEQVYVPNIMSIWPFPRNGSTGLGVLSEYNPGWAMIAAFTGLLGEIPFLIYVIRPYTQNPQ